MNFNYVFNISFSVLLLAEIVWASNIVFIKTRRSRRQWISRCCGGESCFSFTTTTKANSGYQTTKAAEESVSDDPGDASTDDAQGDAISDTGNPASTNKGVSQPVSATSSVLSGSTLNQQITNGNNPTNLPTISVVNNPTNLPTISVVNNPTNLPTTSFGNNPTNLPTIAVVNNPTNLPTTSFGNNPTNLPTTYNPTISSGNSLTTILSVNTNPTVIQSTVVVISSSVTNIQSSPSTDASATTKTVLLSANTETTTALLSVTTVTSTTTTTPTVCTGLCPRYCDPITCTQDNTLFDATTGYLKNIAQYGQSAAVCNSTYLFHTFSPMKTNTEARERCCALGMTILELDTVEKFNCLQNAVNAARPAGLQLWISGIGNTTSLNVQPWRWCNSNKELSPTDPMWDTNYPVAISNINTGVRIQIYAGTTWTAKIQNIPSTISGPYVCVGTTTTEAPLNPRYCDDITCTKDDTLFDPATGYLKNIAQYGQHATVCNSTFLFHTLIPWKTNTAARERCCALGMTILELETVEKFNCLQLAVQSAKPSPSGIWIGGIGNTTSAKVQPWRWCNSQKELSPTDPMWDTNYPVAISNTNTGIRIMVSSGTTWSASIQNIPSTISGPFTCVGTSTTPAPLNPRYCEDITCTKDNTLFDPATGYLKNIAQYGQYATVCNSTYLFHTSSPWKTNTAARERCCALGMTILELETVEKFNCLQLAVQSAKPSQPGIWIGGIGNTTSAKVQPWRWCNSQQELSPTDPMWDTNYPVAISNSNTGIRIMVSSGATWSASIQNIPSTITGPYTCVGTSTPAPGSG